MFAQLMVKPVPSPMKTFCALVITATSSLPRRLVDGGTAGTAGRTAAAHKTIAGAKKARARTNCFFIDPFAEAFKAPMLKVPGHIGKQGEAIRQGAIPNRNRKLNPDLLG